MCNALIKDYSKFCREVEQVNIQYTRYKKLYLTSVCIYMNISSIDLLLY